MSVVFNRPCISEETLVRKCFSQYQVIWNTLMSINMMDLSIIKPVIFSWKKVSVSIEKNVRVTFIKCAHAIVKRVLKKGRRYSYVDIIVILLFFPLSS